MDRDSERIKMVKAMEFIVRQSNAEGNIDPWLAEGVADGDIEYGDLEVKPDDVTDLEYYIEDENFSELMKLFLDIMHYDREDGGLFCGGEDSAQ